MNDIGIVKRNIVRADKAAVERLSPFGVATIHEAMGRVGLMQHYMRPIYAGAQACGTAITVLLQPGELSAEVERAARAVRIVRGLRDALARGELLLQRGETRFVALQVAQRRRRDHPGGDPHRHR